MALTEHPLPLTFYNTRGWVDVLMKHYGENYKVLPLDVLQRPVGLVAHSVGTVIDVYGDYTKNTSLLFEKTINPLIAPEEFQSNVYKKLQDSAASLPSEKLAKIAQNLLNLRLLFEQNRPFLEQMFSKEIAITPAAGGKTGDAIFSTSIQKITIQHITQVIQLIRKFMKEHPK